MISDKRADVTAATAAAVLAVLAIAAPVMSMGQPVQFLAVLGGILLGPGALACRLATGSRWGECLMVGVAVDIAALMVLALTAVAVHFWHPKVELIIPAVTCVLAIVLYRRTARTGQEGN
jgi:hypothetical protein